MNFCKSPQASQNWTILLSSACSKLNHRRSHFSSWCTCIRWLDSYSWWSTAARWADLSFLRLRHTLISTLRSIQSLSLASTNRSAVNKSPVKCSFSTIIASVRTNWSVAMPSIRPKIYRSTGKDSNSIVGSKTSMPIPMLRSSPAGNASISAGQSKQVNTTKKSMIRQRASGKWPKIVTSKKTKAYSS